jgi:hypothetical protein
MDKNPLNNRFITGFLSGLILPVIISIIVFIVSSDELEAGAYINRIVNRNILTHMISVFVFPNVFLFLIFNRFDKLRSARGILGVTILWAILVFIIKMV